MSAELDHHAAASPGATVARLRVIAGLMEHQLERILRRHGLTVGSYNVLDQLRLDARPVTPSELAARIPVPVTTATMTGVVDTLERRGLVTRSPHPTDRRRVLVGLTPSGAELLDRIRPDVDHAQRGWAALLPSVELARLDESLDTLQAALRAPR